ncbi:MAG: hypothetical protein WDO56_05930 [Gammaproteobacteria bacterium]
MDTSSDGHAVTANSRVHRSCAREFEGDAAQPIGMGAKIANSKGVPGSLGCLAETLDHGRPVWLTGWHVLFGNGGGGSETVWRVSEASDARRYAPIGSALHGKRGIVRFRDEDYYVDCAVASCAGMAPDFFATSPAVMNFDVAQPGDRVMKTGAATGTTMGIVVASTYLGSARNAGRVHPTPRQLLIRSLDASAPFAAEGDSGAVVVNSRNAVVGLLWGTSSDAGSVACHISPVLHTLNIRLPAARA